MSGRFYRVYGKRIFDLSLSVPVFFLILPVMAVLGLGVKLTSAGPMIFSQERVGLDGKSFRFYKFRSMVADAPQRGPGVTGFGDNRITGIGRFLRRTKLDELPQLWNVIRGDISLVGPRPELKQYVDLYKEEYAHILRIKPGITDYATLEYSEEESVLAGYSSVEEGYIKVILPSKIKLYKKYLSEVSLAVDSAIILKTILKIV